MNELQQGAETVQSEDKVMLVLSYLGLFCLIPFFIAKNDYVKWHARQGLAFSIVVIVLSVALQILTILLAKALASLLIVATLLSFAFFLGVFVVMVLAIIKALKGIRWPIPFVAGLSAKLFK
ncbi:MAG: DUF4870 domain-containing protein [Cystobacterineae bacterium]|nr:DUF4870 domain-containing protein [Cystobacterineae bacterium]MCL2258935.1 DUF4870 domain-containing protein [Cystobacterineae bacterium]